MVGVLLALSGAYGFHRDELYFIVAGRHPALGYVDQPALTPLLSAASVALLGLTPTAVRVLPALAMGITVVLIALMAGELGGSRRAQVLAAVIAALSGYLAAGHADSTATLDFLAWAVVLWLLVKLLADGDPRLWLGVGVATGIALENKDTIAFLGVGLVAGFVVCRRWEVFRSRWAWGALGIAVLLWLPNLAWQAANGWPQLTMAGSISGDAGDNRASLIPELLLGAGLLLFPVVGIGWAWLLVAAEARPWRPIGIAGIVAIALVFLSGGKGYYAVGIVAPYMAAAGVLVDRWIARGHGLIKGLGFIAMAAMSGALVAYVTLPILSPAA
ncbi:MAG TPA: glycosyltransferase family 39 protein, partial [Candidatus Binatia bacterium]|nr:glycosyltransferase family 39 protein [Candidatus Binatia bacterium]